MQYVQPGEAMGELVELEKRKDIEILRALISRYHEQGIASGGGAAKRHRYFVWVVEGYWCAGAWLHDSTPYHATAIKYRIPIDRSYFIRRICKFCPGDYLVDFLKALAEKLKAEGWEALWTFGFPGHSNATYKLAGFQQLGETTKSRYPVFVKWLQQKA
jgi:hypothetical protein